MRALALACLVAAAACNEDRALPPGGSDGAIDGSDAATVGSDGGGSSDGAAPDLTSACPASETARAMIHLAVANKTPSDVWLASGNLPSPCDPFAVADASGQPLPLTLGEQCGCECPTPPTNRTEVFTVIRPGSTVSLGAWNGQTVVACPTMIDCSMVDGAPPGQTAILYVPSDVDEPPGDYTLTVAYETAPPPGCQPLNSAQDQWGCPFGPGMPSSGTYLSLCPSTHTASVTATLPASGATDALVVIQ